MQVVNMSAYRQAQISTVGAQSGIYGSHMVSISLDGIIYLCNKYSTTTLRNTKPMWAGFEDSAEPWSRFPIWNIPMYYSVAETVGVVYISRLTVV